MRFTSFFEQDFLVKEHITISKVICNEETKTFNVLLKGEKLLDVNSFKKLVSGMQKLASDRALRKYEVNYSINYDDLRSYESKLYLDYYRTILMEVCVDYDLLSLTNYNVSYDNNVYTINVSDLNKISDDIINKATILFRQFGLLVEIKKEAIDKELVCEIKEKYFKNNDRISEDIIKANIAENTVKMPMQFYYGNTGYVLNEYTENTNNLVDIKINLKI